MKQLQAPQSSPATVPAAAGNFSPASNLRTDFSESAPVEAPSGGLLEYWRIIQRSKVAVISFAILGMLGGFLYTVPQTPIYQAKTVIEIQSLNEDFLHMKEVNPNASTSYDPLVELQTQVRILQSRALIDRVIKKVTAESTAPPAPPTRLDAWRSVLHLPQVTPAIARRNAIGQAAGGLRVRAVGSTRLIEILCDSPNPQIAAGFANTLTGEFIEQSLEDRWQTTQHTGEWLARQMQDLKIKLEKSEDALQAYARETNLVITDEKENVANLKLKQLQDELSRAQAERVTRQSRYELATRAAVGSLAEILDDPSLKDIQSKITDLRRQVAELSSSLTPSHPRVLKLQAQIASLDSALQQERVNIVGRIRNDFESAERREKLLLDDYNAIARTVAEQADKVTHYNTLKREVDTNRQIYDSILQRVKEAGVASALRASNISVLDPAIVPGGPYKPNTSYNTMLGLIGGILFGIAAAVFRDRADRTIQEPGDLAFYLGAMELGIVPSASVDPARGGVLPFGNRTLINSSSASVSAKLRSRPTAMAEAFRGVLSSIMFSGDSGTYPRVMVVSSASPKEGKSTLSTNLAVALAEIHKRVLVIDADIRRPSIHRFFNMEKEHGLVDLLRMREAITGPLTDYIHETEIPNLFLMTAGRAAEGDPTLLHSNRLAEVISNVRAAYDFVVIDTPPMLNMSDARIIARQADGVILIARANQTSRDSIKDGFRRLIEDGTPVIGAVLNDWNPKRSTRYGYFGYYDKYKQYYGTQPSS